MPLLTLDSQQTHQLDRVEDSVADLRREVHSLTERVTRIEGRLEGILPQVALTAPEPPSSPPGRGCPGPHDLAQLRQQAFDQAQPPDLLASLAGTLR